MLPRSLEHYYGSDGRLTKPTIKPTPGFSANADAERLHKAMKYLGTDEDAIILVLGKRTSAERRQIADAYKRLFEADLWKELEGDLSRDFKKLCCMSLRSPSELMARCLYESIRGVGTKERVLMEVLLDCSNEEISEVSRDYEIVLKEKGNEDASRTLRSDIMSETHGDFKTLLGIILDGNQDQLNHQQLKKIPDTGLAPLINDGLAKQDAKELYDAGEGRIGTGEKRMMRVVVNRTKFQTKRTAEMYQELYGKSLVDAISSEMSGDLKRALTWIVECALNHDEFYAKRIHDCMRGPGTRDKALMRFILLHCEVDLADIMEAYQRMYDKSMIEDIKGDTSGDYCKLLLTLCGEDVVGK